MSGKLPGLRVRRRDRLTDAEWTALLDLTIAAREQARQQLTVGVGHEAVAAHTRATMLSGVIGKISEITGRRRSRG